jgi:cell division protein FtsA
MNSKKIIGIIELGDLNINCLIANTNNNEAEILSTSTVKSEGFNNNVVTNLSKATNSIRSCISDAERKANITLKKINIIFEQPDFLCTTFSKHKKIDGSKIEKEDIDFLLKEAKKQLIQNDKKQTILHIFNHNYIVDTKIFAEEPIGVYADSLTHEITFITIPKNNVKNINQVFMDCDIEIERLISRTFALGVQLFNEKELQFGSALVDLDFEKTSLGIFKNFTLVHSITFPIGINHITKDISKVCSLSIDESENIKNDFIFSFENKQKIFDTKNYLNNRYFTKSNFRKISDKLITNVIKARLDEILDNLKKQLVVPGLSLNSGINFLVTGEGSKLLGIEKYFFKFFQSNIQLINKEKEVEINEKSLVKNLTAGLGALKIIKDGWETEAIPKITNKNIGKIGFFAKIFKFD